MYKDIDIISITMVLLLGVLTIKVIAWAGTIAHRIHGVSLWVTVILPTITLVTMVAQTIVDELRRDKA